MKPHKWAKEIKAWADGAEIESESQYLIGVWQLDMSPEWDTDEFIFRIKPQPKKSRYLFVYNKGSLDVPNLICVDNPLINMDEKTHQFVGKIKLEAEDEI